MTKRTEFSEQCLEQEEGHEVRLQRIYRDERNAVGIILGYGAK
jgi:hypothetical protein